MAGNSMHNAFEQVLAMMRIEIPFRSIISGAQWQKSSPTASHVAVYFRVAHPPRIFRRSQTDAQGRFRSQQGDCTWDVDFGDEPAVQWVRTVDPTDSAAFSRVQGFRILLAAPEARKFMNELRSTRLVSQIPPRPKVVHSKRTSRASVAKSLFVQSAPGFNLSFQVRYELECLISTGALLLSDLEKCTEFWEILRGLDEEKACLSLDMMCTFAQLQEEFTLFDPAECLKEAMDVLQVSGTDDTSRDFENSSDVTDSKIARVDEEGSSSESSDADSDNEFLLRAFVRELNIGNYPPCSPNLCGSAFSNSERVHVEDTRDRFEAMDLTTKRSKAETHQTYIRTLLLTPSRVIAHHADADLLNRVLREFKQHKDRFLRARFADEDGSSISYVGSEDILTKIRQLLEVGVEVAGERFVFLVFSSSQLRDHGMWMYNETRSSLDEIQPPSASDIRTWMGDFSLIRVSACFAVLVDNHFCFVLGIEGDILHFLTTAVSFFPDPFEVRCSARAGLQFYGRHRDFRRKADGEHG